jgi:Fe-S-cluster-containing dehydrogenase component
MITKFKEAAISAFIHTHFDKCTGCRICQLACSLALTGGYNPRRVPGMGLACYTARGWDPDGKPSPKTLHRLEIKP